MPIRRPCRGVPTVYLNVLFIPTRFIRVNFFAAMGGCRCSYKNCKSATKTTENLHFFHYPVKHTERCRKWIENASKPQFFDLAEDQLRNKVVCELHFEDKCFTNVSRRRLLHDAIPTLDAESEQEVCNVEYTNNVQYAEAINVVPASADGTLFTVDTDSFQQIPVSQKIDSYVYNNGALVPIYKSEAINVVEESVLYAVENSNIEVEHRVTKAQNGVALGQNNVQPQTYKLVFNNLAQGEVAECMSLDEIDEPNQEETSNSAPDSPPQQFTLNLASNQIEIEEKPLKKEKGIVNTKVPQRVNHNSKEITYLKKTLKFAPVPNHYKNKKTLLTALASIIPPTLYTLVTRTAITNSEVDITDEDVECFKEIYTTSPNLYKNLREKYGWNFPDASSFC